jgi:hypothetical protein
VEGIETKPQLIGVEGTFSSKDFPDLEGIETGIPTAKKQTGKECSKDFPDVEGTSRIQPRYFAVSANILGSPRHTLPSLIRPFVITIPVAQTEPKHSFTAQQLEVNQELPPMR